MGEFTDKVALITGAAVGIGFGAAEAFAREGAHAIMVDIDRAGEDAARRITAAGGKASFEHCDVSDAAAVDALFDKIARDFGRLDYGVNNAGIDLESAQEPAWDVDIFDRVTATNLRGVFLCMRGEIRLMRQAGAGAIVNVSSIGGLRGEANKPCYIASKHAVMGLTKSAGRQLAGEGIRVNAFCPGTIDTPATENHAKFLNISKEELTKWTVRSHFLKRLGTTLDCAYACLYLASDESTFVTGTSLVVDGGYLPHSGMIE
jgi:NAD(P)-dependent dehydrogenase (short-subunit alcohol dehydrogenase family)